MVRGSETTATSATTGCSARRDAHARTTVLRCHSAKGHATARYVFALRQRPMGSILPSVDRTGSGHTATAVERIGPLKVAVTVTLRGVGATTIDSVSISYYAR